ncbi:MAG: dihydroorotase [Betaproteobacteria bacterium]|nr:dihydroorotase [Betaproteobacteria bacterium]
MSRVTIIRPDDWHLHLRDGDHMRAVLPDTARRFARAIVMPNLTSPVTTTEMALGYHERIKSALPDGMQFEPLMTLYLTDNTTADEIRRAKQSGVVHAVKYYPAGATTNSESGVTELIKCEDALAAMEECGLPLLVHGEVTFPNVDIFDREKIFIDRVLVPVLQKFPKLRVVFEHITTKEAARFVLASPPRVAATITAHHLLLNRNALFAGGIRPHHYCLPILKREEDRQALIQAAVSGNPKFFLGTDGAPHARHTKEAECGCAGMYTAHAAIELYAEIFGANNALERLEGFASSYGPNFYGLPRNQDRITLVKEVWNVPKELPFHKDTLVPFRAGGTVSWRML